MRRLLFNALARCWGFCRGVREACALPLDFYERMEEAAREGGYVWAPYVAVNFMPREGFEAPPGAQTRYSSQKVRPDYYGQVVVAEL